jgi:hypothetical protein
MKDIINNLKIEHDNTQKRIDKLLAELKSENLIYEKQLRYMENIMKVLNSLG